MKTIGPILLLVAASALVAAQSPQVRPLLLDRAVQHADAQVMRAPLEGALIRLSPGLGVQPDHPTVLVDARNVDSVSLVSGEVLHGTLVSLEPGVDLKWKHEVTKEEFTIPSSKFRLIRLDKPRPYTNTPPNCRLYFRNDDQLAGNLVSLDASLLTLETGYAGTLTVPRNQVQTLFTLLGSTSTDPWWASGTTRPSSARTPTGSSSGSRATFRSASATFACLGGSRSIPLPSY